MIQDLIFDLAKSVALFLLGGLIIMIGLHIAHADVSHSIPALGYSACFAAACVLSIGVSLLKLFVAVD